MKERTPAINNIKALNLWKEKLSLKNNNDTIINKVPLPFILLIILNDL